MNFVAAMLILGRLPQSFTGSYSLNPESENDTQNVDKLNNLDILDPNSDYCLHAEYDVYFFLLQVSDKGSKLAMNSMWQSGQSQIKLRAFQLDKILRWLVPALHTHFYDIQLTPEVSYSTLKRTDTHCNHTHCHLFLTLGLGGPMVCDALFVYGAY